MLLATVLAPATRFGYLIYPLNLLTWAVLLKPSVAPAGESSQSSGAVVGDLEKAKPKTQRRRGLVTTGE